MANLVVIALSDRPCHRACAGLTAPSVGCHPETRSGLRGSSLARFVLVSSSRNAEACSFRMPPATRQLRTPIGAYQRWGAGRHLRQGKPLTVGQRPTVPRGETDDAGSARRGGGNRCQQPIPGRPIGE